MAKPKSQPFVVPRPRTIKLILSVTVASVWPGFSSADASDAPTAFCDPSGVTKLPRQLKLLPENGGKGHRQDLNRCDPNPSAPAIRGPKGPVKRAACGIAAVPAPTGFRRPGGSIKTK
jgi:hypothetical protein